MKSSLDKRRWGVLGICCLLNICVGSIYAFSVFSISFAERLTAIAGYDIVPADLAIVFTMATSIGTTTMILGGNINDRLGSRWVVFTGGILYGLGMALSGYVTSIGTLALTFGLMLALATGLVYGVAVSSAVKFFPDKRGLIGGIVVAFFGLSSAVMSPIANTLIEARGITNAVTIMAIAIMLIVCICSFFIPKCPPDYKPEGWTPVIAKTHEGADRDKNWKQMLRTPAFYPMLGMMLLGTFSGLMVISQAKPIGMEIIGLDSPAATAIVSVLAFFSVGGRVVGGIISDRIGRIKTFMLTYAVSVVGMLCLYFAAAEVLFYIGICAVGLCFGSILGIFPGFTTEQFGTKNNSVNFGIVFTGYSVAAAFGSIMMSHIYKASGVYQPAFMIAAVMGAAGVALTFIFKMMTAQRSR